MYWLLVEKPEKDFCCRAYGEFVGGYKTIKKIGPELVSDKPLEVPFPGFVIEKLNDQYHKGKPRPPGDYLESGSDYIVSARLRSLLEEIEIDAEYYPLEIKAKLFETDQPYFYLRLMPRIECMNREKSEYEVVKYESGYESVRNVSKLVINEAAIPTDMPMLRMEELHIILVNDAFKNAIEESDITCVHFITPEDYPRSHEIYGDLVEETTKKR